MLNEKRLLKAGPVFIEMLGRFALKTTADKLVDAAVGKTDKRVCYEAFIGGKLFTFTQSALP